MPHLFWSWDSPFSASFVLELGFSVVLVLRPGVVFTYLGLANCSWFVGFRFELHIRPRFLVRLVSFLPVRYNLYRFIVLISFVLLFGVAFCLLSCSCLLFGIPFVYGYIIHYYCHICVTFRCFFLTNFILRDFRCFSCNNLLFLRFSAAFSSTSNHCNYRVFRQLRIFELLPTFFVKK